MNPNRCLRPVMVEERAEKSGRLLVTSRTWMGCKLEEGHDGPCVWWPVTDD